MEPYGAVLDNKGNRVPGLDGTGKRPVSTTVFGVLIAVCGLSFIISGHVVFNASIPFPDFRIFCHLENVVPNLYIQFSNLKPLKSTKTFHFHQLSSQFKE